MNLKELLQVSNRRDVHEDILEIKNELKEINHSVQGLRDAIRRLAEAEVLRMSKPDNDL
tara:strand:- start:216 stop:392 length:177 start_codon:yes stop_codon:yes gene_type:complete